jgi:hypothetical protein
VRRRLLVAPVALSALSALGALAALAVPAAVSAQDEPPDSTPPASGGADRQWLVPIPIGCDAPPLPDVVFVGTLQASDYRTGRFRVDQVRAGAIERYSYGGVVDVRFGIDTKYLDTGTRYLVGASYDPDAAVLTSKVRAAEPLFGGDEVIGAAETDVDCPVLEDPVRTLLPDGSSVDSGVLTPLTGAKRSLLRALLLPLGVALAAVFALVALRWLVTGIGWGVSSFTRTMAEPREVRAVLRSGARARQPEGPSPS